ncbi:MAG: hypothetical protein CMM35_15680 [Rhodospirillaceae bacterium]|nr:hypothetical protein [Rhodospirillaceae bacterium]
MCGRYAITMPVDSMRELFGFEAQPNLGARYNVAPTQEIPAVRTAYGGEGRELAALSWGLVPSWSDNPVTANRMINARGETIAEKPSFRSAFKRRRCLIPANGFYEWKGDRKGPKQPFYIQLEDGLPFAFAGIWERWEGGDGDHWETCAIVTTNANDALRPIHHRMPVILPPESYDNWLTSEPKDASALMIPYMGEIQTWPVATLVNKVVNDGPELLERSEETSQAVVSKPAQMDLF